MESIIVNGRRYHRFEDYIATGGTSLGGSEGGGLEPHPTLVPNEGGGGGGDVLATESEDRSFLAPQGSGFNLSNTVGLYITIGGKNILFVIDKNTVPYNSDAWHLVITAILQLQTSYQDLTPQARESLGRLDIVIFSSAPNRSFSDVIPNRFFYDTSEFLRSDGSLISASFAASAIIHDAHHIWQFDERLRYAGREAEIAGWQLQVDNSVALGLSQLEIDHLNSLIQNPQSQDARLQSPPY